MITSLGFHTFTIFQRLTYYDALKLYDDFKNHEGVRVRPYGMDENHPGTYPKGYIIEYLEKGRGISWYLRFSHQFAPLVGYSNDSLNPGYLSAPEQYSVRATINPKILLWTKDYLAAATEDYLDDVEAVFNKEAAKISPILRTFDYYSMNRIDYCLNIDLEELHMGCTPEQMIALIKRGDTPRHFTESVKYDKKSHRPKANADAHYLQSKSITINYYAKQEQLYKMNPDCPDLDAARNLVRYEIQCEYPKVYSLAKDKRFESKLYNSMSEEELCNAIMDRNILTVPIDLLISDSVAKMITEKYFNKVIRKGDYFTLAGARWMVKKHGFRQSKEERLLSALDTVNVCRGIAKVKRWISGDGLHDVKRSLHDLDEILVNPVTIPREWGIKHIPNPLRAYNASVADNQVLNDNEIRFSELLAEYLS